jgi:Repeat of unknown function (DUF5907)
MTSRTVREFLRSHVLGLVAIFIALTGTAVAGQQSGSSGGPTASASIVTDAKFKKLKKRVAALEAKTTLPPSGPAGGDLTGSYPNPLIADNAVTTAKIANGQVRAADLGNLQLVEATGNVANNATDALDVPCPAGTRLISGGGGVNLGAPPAGVSVTASLKLGDPEWRVIVRNDSGMARPIFVQALCLQV